MSIWGQQLESDQNITGNWNFEGSSIWATGNRIPNMTNLGTVNTAATLAFNSLVFCPIPIQENIPIQAIEFRYVSGASRYILGLWDMHPTTKKPLNLIEQSAQVSVGAAGIKTFTLSTPYTPSQKLVYVSLIVSVSNATIYKVTTGAPIIKLHTDFSSLVVQYATAFVFGALPSDTSLLTLTDTTGTPPLVTLQL